MDINHQTPRRGFSATSSETTATTTTTATATSIKRVATVAGLLLAMAAAASMAPVTHGVDVKIAVLLPFDNSYMFSYHRVAPAMEIAIDTVRRMGFLHRVQFVIRFNDSMCNIAVAMDRAINFFMNRQVDVFLGPVCDFAVAPVARQLSFWNVPMVTPGAMAMDFSSHRLSTYPLLTRVGPVHTEMAHFFGTVARHYGWNKVKLLYSKEGQGYLMKSLCHLMIEALHYTLNDESPELEQDYYKMSERQTTEEIISVLEDEVGADYGVVVLCASPDAVREIMIQAHELNFDNGEYVFFNIDLFTSKDNSQKPWYRAGDSADRNEKAKKAYEALMTVTLRKPTSPEYKTFSKTVKQRAKELYHNENFTYGEDEVNSFVGAFHDAVILYALALNESLEAGVSITNGSEITRRMWNRTFEGITGTVSIDSNGDRNADYSLLDLDPVTERFQVVANYYGNRKQYEPVISRSISWAGGRTEPPTDTPECGFDGSKCPPDEPFPEYGIVIIVLGSIILIVLVAALFIYRNVEFHRKQPSDVADSLPFKPLNC